MAPFAAIALAAPFLAAFVRAEAEAEAQTNPLTIAEATSTRSFNGTGHGVIVEHVTYTGDEPTTTVYDNGGGVGGKHSPGDGHDSKNTLTHFPSR